MYCASLIRRFGSALALVALAAALHAADAFADRAPRYRLHTSDVIAVNFRLTPEYNYSATVQPDGFISLPGIGDINVFGLTLAETTERVKTKAGEKLNNPEVSVQVMDFEKPYYIVGGEVGQPGRFNFRGPITALRAIETAGGFRISARSNQVLLIRPINDTEAETHLIDVSQMLKGRNLKEDIVLRAGDIVVVPERRLTKVQRYIQMSNFGMYINPFNL